MKFSYPVLLLVASCLFAASCTKNNDVTTTIHDSTTIIQKDTVYIKNPKNPITGFWVGSFQYDDYPTAGSYYYSLSLFEDNTVVNMGGGQNGVLYMAKGTWSLSTDSILTVHIAADPLQANWTQTLTAKYSSANGTLSNGIWAYTSGGTQAGTFLLKRTD
ncbi:MAG TPA: hypothetical protein VHC48_01210 [Puia sp.]|jgi:hypothetical protein|nr:hypothetical protein [Puia sp.]